jgi:hypothetical protein
MKRARRTLDAVGTLCHAASALDRDVLCALCREPGSQAASAIIA